jgi:hypothetical protein
MSKPVCSVEGCKNESERSLAHDKVSKALKEASLSVSLRPKERRVNLCKTHYRAIKKFLKKERKLERDRWGGF